MDELVINLNDFKILKKIGNGNFGCVFLVRHTITNAEYAAKVSIQEFYSEDLQKSFLNEITSYPKVKHPAILTLFGYNLLNFDRGPFPTIITQYMPNGSLDSILEKEYCSLAPHQFSSTKKYIIMLGIARGMHFLHEQKIIHRDLKPQNILLDENFYPHICDFGLSVLSVLPELTMSDFTMESGVGTPLYMAPEIISDKPYTYKVDVYAFSLIAYELLTGKPPYEHFSSIFKLQCDVKDGYRPDLKYIHDKDIQDFLKKCWSNNPNERPSFKQIIEELMNERYKIAFDVNEEEIEEYLDLYDEEQKLYSIGYLKIQKDADQGNVKSMVKFGVMLLKGDGIEINKKEAARYLKSAADLGDKEAMFHYGLMLSKGDGIKINKKEGSRYLKTSADRGESRSMYHYGLMLEKGDGIQKNIKEAIRYIKMSADKGETIAMLKYGDMVYDGKGIVSNKKEAANYYKMSADQGNITSMENYGNMLYEGKGIEINKKEAARYFKMAADQNHIDSMYKYGMMLYYGDGIEMSKKESIRYFKKAADKGNTNAMLNLSSMYLNEKEIETDLDKYFYYLKMAADNGNAEAMANLGVLLREGENGFNIDKKSALNYFKLAALKGHPKAIFYYANMLDEGDGVDVNKKEAARYYKMAASQGNTTAMFKIALMLHGGDGIAVNRKEAARYFKMAANKGDSGAMYNYGMMLKRGDGIPPNKKEANRYLNMAALQGNSIAIAELLNPMLLQ